MALNFPPTPSNGDYDSTGKWQFSSTPSPGVWKAVAASPTVAYPSPTAPANPKSGDLWYNTSNGLVYIYYTDQDTSQWVEIKANSALGTTLGTRVDALETRSPNYLLNGGFDIWQRGDSVDQGSKPGADQWYFYYYYAMSQIRITSGVPATSSSAVRVRSNSNGNLVVGIQQVLETKNAVRLWGKKVTFSIKVRRAGTMVQPLTLLVYKHANVDQSPSAGSWTNISSVNIPNSVIPTGTSSTDWYTASITVDIPKDGSANTLWFEVRASGGMDNGVYYEVAEAQVEEGNSATAFRRQTPSIQAELAACQRYYWRFTQVDNYQFWTLCSNWGGELMGAIKLPVTMRVTPSISFSDLASVYWLGNSTNYSGATSFSGRPSKEIWAFACSTAGVPANVPVMMRPYVNTYAEATAEL